MQATAAARSHDENKARTASLVVPIAQLSLLRVRAPDDGEEGSFLIVSTSSAEKRKTGNGVRYGVESRGDPGRASQGGAQCRDDRNVASPVSALAAPRTQGGHGVGDPLCRALGTLSPARSSRRSLLVETSSRATRNSRASRERAEQRFSDIPRHRVDLRAFGLEHNVEVRAGTDPRVATPRGTEAEDPPAGLGRQDAAHAVPADRARDVVAILSSPRRVRIERQSDRDATSRARLGSRLELHRLGQAAIRCRIVPSLPLGFRGRADTKGVGLAGTPEQDHHEADNDRYFAGWWQPAPCSPGCRSAAPAAAPSGLTRLSPAAPSGERGEESTTMATASPDLASADGVAIRPYRFEVSDEDLADLRRRIAATRWPEPETVADETAGRPVRDDEGARRPLGDRLRLAHGRGAAQLAPALPDGDRWARHPLHPRPLEARGRAADHRHARLAGLVHRAAQDHRAADRPDRARRQRVGRLRRRDPVAARTRVLGASRPRRAGIRRASRGRGPR